MTAPIVSAVETPPEITASGVYDILDKIVPFGLSGMDVSISAGFERCSEKVTFALEHTEQSEPVTDTAPFLAAVRANQEVLAARLSEARSASRLSGTETVVSLDGIDMDPAWPSLVLSAGPYVPEEDDDDLDEEDDDDV